MPMNRDAAARTLDAIADLVDLLRLSHSAAHRVEAELYGNAFNDADALSQQLHELRRSASELQMELEQFVSRESARPEIDSETPLRGFGSSRAPGRSENRT